MSLEISSLSTYAMYVFLEKSEKIYSLDHYFTSIYVGVRIADNDSLFLHKISNAKLFKAIVK